ncbi:MAG: PcfJ domain-containing protein, partial [Clostridia bacterium]|nr:PcfJ domain-containing protein [Clostridia bacterium]
LNVDFNKVDINVGYVMAMLAQEIDDKDRKLISCLDAQIVSAAVSLKLFYDGFSAAEFVRWYYRKTLAGAACDSEIRMCAEDYVEMCIEAGEKLRLGYDADALIRAHDELSIRNRIKANKEEFGIPLLAVPSKFDALETAIKDTGSAGFERICTTERLFREGEYQHNCVFSRRGSVRKDRASIYHWDHKGESYTIQFSRDKRKHYFVEEIKARFNRSITEEHLSDLRQMLAGVCAVDIEVCAARGLPQPEPDERPYPRWAEADFGDDQLAFDLPF